MLRLNPWPQSGPTVMKSMPRLNFGLRRTLKHHTSPGKNVFLQEVSTVKRSCTSYQYRRLTVTSVTILVITVQEAASKPQGKAELRKQYLLEKYVWKWKQFMRSRKGEVLFPRLLKLSHNNWLRQVQNKNNLCWISTESQFILSVLSSLLNYFKMSKSLFFFFFSLLLL